MTTTGTGSRQHAIRNALAQRAGDAPDSRTVAEAARSTWHQVMATLAPVIGGQGVNIIFHRALHLRRESLPGLVIGGDAEQSAAQLASLIAWLEAAEPNAAAEASNALLVTFTEVLVSLIGESLTNELLNPVWSSPAPTFDQEKTP